MLMTFSHTSPANQTTYPTLLFYKTVCPPKWLANNFLQLNTDKTEVLIIAPDILAPEIAQRIGFPSPVAQAKLKNLGVNFDRTMRFEEHTSH